jgi:hypothetical protein
MKGSTRTVAILVAAGLAAAVGFAIYKRVSGGAQHSALNQREVATRVMAEYLAGQFPGKRALVVSNPFTQQKGQNPQIYVYEEAGQRGVLKGFGGATRAKVVFPALRPEFLQNRSSVYVDPKTTTPLSFLVAEDSFDALAKENPGHEIIISLIGLPVNLGRLEIWKKPDGPQFALLLPDLRWVGNRDAVRAVIQSGKIAAAVLNKPGAPPESAPLTQDYKAEFANRYLLLTKESIDQLLQTYPQLLTSP